MVTSEGVDKAAGAVAVVVAVVAMQSGWKTWEGQGRSACVL